MTKEAARKRIIKELRKKTKWSPITIKEILMDISPSEKINRPIKEIMFFAARSSNTSINRLMNGSRERQNVLARSLVYYALKKQGYTLVEIGKRFGKDHATVLHGLRSLKNDLESKDELTVMVWEKFKKLNYGL